MIGVFGMGDYSKTHLTGKYAVGHKLHWLSNAKKNQVGVFYPVDKEYEESVKNMKTRKTFKPQIDYTDIKAYWNGKGDATEWILG